MLLVAMKNLKNLIFLFLTKRSEVFKLCFGEFSFLVSEVLNVSEPQSSSGGSSDRASE